MGTRMAAADIEAELARFSGTENYHRHWVGFVYTDGVKFLADAAGAHWFLDVIGSYQPGIARKARGKGKKAESWRGLVDMQFWTLKVLSEEEREGKAYQAVVTCDDGNGKVMIRQEIGHTDFPLSEAKVWVELGSIDGINRRHVAMLPGER
jgi:hypothetical protein